MIIITLLLNQCSYQFTAMDEILRKTKSSQCEICAYHEGGHILFAYLCGYTCKEVQLVNENEEGFTSYSIIDYGKDATIASRFLAEEGDLAFFNLLSLGEKLDAVEVGRRLARIFMGGTVAAAIFKNGGNLNLSLPMQMDFSDMKHAESIRDVIIQISPDKEDFFIENGLRDALYTMTNINVWETVADLSNRILKQSQLGRNDIEECLEEHGIIYPNESSVTTGL
jgi:hypothetical protein